MKVKNKIAASAIMIILSSIQSIADALPDRLFDSRLQRSTKLHLIVAFDRSGLNNHYSCDSLSKRNIQVYQKLLTKQAIRRFKVKTISIFVFDEQIKLIKSIQEDRPAKLYRALQNSFETINANIDINAQEKAKDIIGALQYLADYSNKRYMQKNDKVLILIFSNLRDTVHTKQQLIQLEPIIFRDNVYLKLYIASGLECLHASTSQILNAEASYKELFAKKILANKSSFFTIYGER